MKLPLIALVSLLPLLPFSVQSKDVLGAGTASCGSWLEAKEEPTHRQVYGQWILGFISGSNWRSERQARPIDNQAVFAFVDAYCTKNPTHMLTMSAAAAIEVTGGPKALHKWIR